MFLHDSFSVHMKDKVASGCYVGGPRLLMHLVCVARLYRLVLSGVCMCTCSKLVAACGRSGMK